MRVPLEWLRELVPLTASATEVAHRLTDAGFEVAAIHGSGQRWERVVVGEVVRIDPHPNADRLNLPTVNYGDGVQQVVCGAWNFKVGDRVALARVGAKVFDPYAPEPVVKELVANRIRGVLSEGMLCSPKELGLGAAHDGILVLDPRAAVGTPLAQVLGDEVIEFELKPNRPDALSLLGIAREAAALYGLAVRSPLPPTRAPSASQLTVPIEIEDATLCPRYSAALVRDVTVGPSPAWLARRLELAGVRPINNVVDVTNYVMLEVGQPLHAFDWATLRDGRVGVRLARPGERLTTLDGHDRELAADTLLIVDGAGPIALAGVMGGLATEVSGATATVLIESATFNQFSIRRAAQRLALRSEASRRFEKGLPPELTVLALRRCVRLLEEIGAGRGDDLTADAYPQPQVPAPVRLRFDAIERLMGVRYEHAEVLRVLRAIECTVEAQGDELVVTPPFWRRDVADPADVIEEVARLVGYDAIPDTLPVGGVTGPMPGEVDPRLDQVRDILAGLGFHECITYALTSPDRLARLVPPELRSGDGEAPAPPAAQIWRRLMDGHMNAAGRDATERLLPLHLPPIELVNPLSADENVLRLTSLGRLLETLRANRRASDRDLWLFEVGPIFVPRSGDLPEERKLATLVTGATSTTAGWSGAATVGFLHVKAAVDEVLVRLGFAVSPEDGREPPVRHIPLQHPSFLAAAAAAVTVDGEVVGAYGEIHPSVATAFGLPEAAWAAILDLDRVLARMPVARAFVPWSEHPPVRRDLAIVVDLGVAHRDVELTVRRTGKGIVTEVRLFDEYRGAQVPPGKRSLAYALTYRTSDRTLTDAEVDAMHQRIVTALGKRFGAVLRG
ncbi:MAG: phenylalanine--tRNA ligase subunit beta [Actinobacteria bacterium]|nr:phenylalanine--tRNA ligase subunit beta [Actinomycetota bacterium]